jgi:hypothetical protein
MAVVIKSEPIKFIEAIKDALGLEAEILDVTIKAPWHDIVTVELKIAMERGLQDEMIAKELRRYKLVPLDEPEKS